MPEHDPTDGQAPGSRPPSGAVDAPALHEMDPCGRFSDRAGDYVRYRPDYPATAIDHAIDGLGPAEQLTAADVGAGTGISARRFADRGVHVYAVEPNPSMRASALPHARVEWREGSAEHTGLAPASVRLVVCAQAFHWFRPRESLAEFHRVLQPDGRLVLIWNVRSHTDVFTVGYTDAIRAVSGEHAAEMRPFDPAVVSDSEMFEPPALARFDHVQQLDRAGLLGRATSASYVPKHGEAFERLAGLLGALHERHRDADGIVSLRYVTEVWCARRDRGPEQA